VLRLLERSVPWISAGLFVLTLVVFLGPAAILGSPDELKPTIGPVVDAFGAALLAWQSAALAASLVLLVERVGLRSHPIRAAAVVGGTALAFADATLLELSVVGSGPGWEIGQVLAFAGPLVLWSAVTVPTLKGIGQAWWAAPLRMGLLAFPSIFLVAALSRIDFQRYTGTPTPTPILWLLAYVPTLVVIAVAIAGWRAFEEGRGRTRRVRAARFAVIALPAFAVGGLASAATSVGFIVTATITWGSGYQLFVNPAPFPPLALSLGLVAIAIAGYLATITRLRRAGMPVLGPALALAAVLSGIFPRGASVLGSLAALELLWITVFRPGPAR
jgi:hypothetical protein